MANRALYYYHEKPTAFSTLDKLSAAIPRKIKSDIRAWLEYQDAYTIHRPVRKRFLHNTYTVTKLMDIWECITLDMQSLAKYNDTYSYYICNRGFIEISTSGAHKYEEQPCGHLGVPIHISR